MAVVDFGVLVGEGERFIWRNIRPGVLESEGDAEVAESGDPTAKQWRGFHAVAVGAGEDFSATGGEGFDPESVGPFSEGLVVEIREDILPEVGWKFGWGGVGVIG